jgi:hypothetical protein
MLLLVKDIDCLSKLYESHSFSVIVLPPCFGPLGCFLLSGDGRLFMAKPLDPLLHSGHLLFATALSSDSQSLI